MKKTCYTLLIAFLLGLSTHAAHAQDYLVSSTYLGTKTKLDIFAIFFQLVDYDVDLYAIEYLTPGISQGVDTASGLLAIPKVDPGTQLPLVVYGHGTVAGPTDVPSMLRGGYEATLAFAGSGFITVAPDYLGLGRSSSGFHPYVHAATEASASLDMLNASLEYLDFNEPEWDPNFLFITGYSQGGHTSMALHQELDDFWSFVYPVTAATHMSGPYSISGVMKDIILDSAAYTNPAYMAYIMLGYNEIYDLFDDVNEVFKDPYIADINMFYTDQINLNTLNARLLTTLAGQGESSVRALFQDSVITAIETNPDHPINLALEENDTYNFAPKSPTRLYYCGGDEQVPFENALVAEEEMINLGATDVQAISLHPSFDHGTCVLPAFINSIAFFQSFLNPSGITRLNSVVEIPVYPNPAIDDITIPWDDFLQGGRFTIHDLQGRLIHSGQTSTNRISVEQLPVGNYTLTMSTEQEVRVARFIRI